VAAGCALAGAALALTRRLVPPASTRM
jgi:hypothetical protein